MTTNATEKIHFFEPTTESSFGNFDTRNFDYGSKWLIIVCLGGSQKDTVLPNSSCPLAEASQGAAFKGFVVVGAGDSEDGGLTTAHLSNNFSRGFPFMSQCKDSHNF